MTIEANKTIVRRYFEEIWNKGNLELADLLVAPNFSVEGCGGAISGLEAVKLYISSYRALYPGIHFTVLSLTAEGDKVAACWVRQGATSTSADHDEDTGGQTRRTTGLSIYRIANGQIAEAWVGSSHPGDGSDERIGITRNSRS